MLGMFSDMENNLISLGTLDSQGYKFSSEGGVLRVCKGDLVVIQGNLICPNVYLLQGSTVINAPLISCLFIKSIFSY